MVEAQRRGCSPRDCVQETAGNGCWNARASVATAIVDLAPVDARGRAIGVQGAVTGAGAIVAGLWAGLAWSGTGRVPLVVAGSVAAMVGVGMLASGRALDPPRPSAPVMRPV